MPNYWKNSRSIWDWLYIKKGTLSRWCGLCLSTLSRPPGSLPLPLNIPSPGKPHLTSHLPSYRLPALKPGHLSQPPLQICHFSRTSSNLPRPSGRARSRRCGKWTHAGQGLLNQRQARSAQRLYTRPKDGQGPEKIFTRDGAALASRLRAAASFRPGDTFEAQGRNS